MGFIKDLGISRMLKVGVPPHLRRHLQDVASGLCFIS